MIKRGGLVAFPTETVYGLGANAFNEAAVKSIFAAKGRPADNPLIVHIDQLSLLNTIAKDAPPSAQTLAEAFWPGALTLVMRKHDNVPGVVSAGLSTVAVRLPAHTVARSLIKESGVPIAAPSANLSGRPSPTDASHVIDDLYGKVDVIIDSGRCSVGLESTILDITATPPVVLRPGSITMEQIRRIIVDTYSNVDESVPLAPGMKYTHYSPNANVIVVRGTQTKVVDKINKMVKDNIRVGIKMGILATDQTMCYYLDGEVISVGDRQNPETMAFNLFNAFREFDKRNVRLILAEAVEDIGIGQAIMNRMNKAAGYVTVDVG